MQNVDIILVFILNFLFKIMIGFYLKRHCLQLKKIAFVKK